MPTPGDQASLWWLGQAGFALRYGDWGVVIDPYLSDSLADKYRGTRFPHLRMMPAPIKPHELKPVNLVLCTHRHSDHMDPGTLPLLLAANPGCKVAIPRAELDSTLGMGIEPERIIALNHLDTHRPGKGLCITALASAHEELKTDQSGQHHFLGYVLHFDGIGIYHSGDCIPYPGLAERLKELGIDLALLPVNGRDHYRKSHGIPGNFHLHEALELCRAAKIPRLLCHHFGMFEFNTIPPDELRAGLAKPPKEVEALAIEAGIQYSLSG
jgi:L-ascorbate metabolism protein UlaG (beta-lactamase superfamily)